MDYFVMVDVRNRPRSQFIVSLFLVVIALATYWQLPSHDFLNFDDNVFITQNTHVRKGITCENIAWAFSINDDAYWHPLTWLSHMLDVQLFGLNPGLHHLINLFLHIANILLLFLTLKWMTGSLWQSAFVAAVFALHPLNIESVAWASERKNVLSTFFWMLTILTYAHYAKQPGFYRYLLTFFVFALGLMTKPMLVTLPFVLLLLDYWPLRRFTYAPSGIDRSLKTYKFVNTEFQRSSPSRLVLEKIPLFALSAVSIYLSSLFVQHLSSVSARHLGVVISMESVPMKLRIANALVSYVTYIKKMIWPQNLAVFYPYPEVLPFWQAAGAGLLLIFVSILVFRTMRSRPYITVGWLWYIGTLVPVIGLVQVGLWPAMADRFAYVPLIGLFTIIAWGVPDFMPKWRYRRIGFTVTVAAILAIMMITTRLQIRYWSNSVTLFEHVLEVTVDNCIVHAKLGETLADQGKIDAAVRHYHEALRIKPDFVAPLLNLGVALKEKGELNEAINYFSKVLRMRSNHADAHYELGDTLERKGDFGGAIKHYLEAIRIKPDRAKTYNNLGIVLVLQNKDKEAIIRFYEALRIDPAYAGAYYNLGKVFANQGKIKEAILNYRKALSFSPYMQEALYNLSWILACHVDEKYRNGKEAVQLAETLCKITNYKQPLAFDALAAAYAEAGRLKEAVLTAQKGLELALKMGSKELAPGLENRLQLYHAGRPYRQK